MNAREFWNVVLRSGALGESETRRAMSQWQGEPRTPDADSPAAIAQWLQSHGFLTSFQTQGLLRKPPGSLRIGRYVLVDQVREGFFAQAFRIRKDSHRYLLDTLAVDASPVTLRRLGDANAFLQRHVELHHQHLQTCHEVLSKSGPGNKEVHTSHLGIEPDARVATSQVWRIVLDLPPGEPLVHHRPEQPLTAWCERFRQWNDALQAMHDAGCIHGRIGPGALFGGEEVALLARRPCRPTNFELWAQAPTKIAIADAACLPPELVLGTAMESPATDVFALGAAFLFALTGNTPLSGSSVEQVCERARTWGTDRPVLLWDLPGDWQRLFHDLLHESPEHRIQSPRELAHRLDEMEPGRLIPHIATAPLPRSRRSPSPTWLGARRTWQAVMGLLSVGLVVWLLWSWRNPPTPSPVTSDAPIPKPAIAATEGTRDGAAQPATPRREPDDSRLPSVPTRRPSDQLWLDSSDSQRWPLAASPPGAECFLWLRPRDGLAMPEGERLVRSLDALQPWRLVPTEFDLRVDWGDVTEAVICLIPQEVDRWQMTVGLQVHPDAKWPEAWSRGTSDATEAYIVRAESVEGKPTADMNRTPSASEVVVLVLSQSGRRVMIGPHALLEPLSKALPVEPLLRRDLERLWGRTRRDQVAGCLFTPRILKSDGLALLPPPLQTLAALATPPIEDGLLAGMAAIRLDEHEAFVEVHLAATLERREEILADLLERLSKGPAAVETFLVESEVADPAWRRFALRLVPMARFVSEHARYRTDEGPITLLFSLPATALHNLSLGLQFPR